MTDCLLFDKTTMNCKATNDLCPFDTVFARCMCELAVLKQNDGEV